MTTRLFALIIGIDRYKSGRIWDLHSCVEDAQNIRKWLTGELKVPKSNICTLLDHDATKHNIETAFMQHLVNNPAIEANDAILVYFAGHGSTMHAPPGWYDEQTSGSPPKVHLLSTFDHDSATQHGRTSGISDCSLRSLLDDLAATKGNNITVMLDCCFVPAKNVRDRKFVRSTATTKVQADDLYRDLWVSAREKARSPKTTLFSPSTSYVLLSACAPERVAFEGKEGGRFTMSFLHAVKAGLPLHQATYPQLIDKMSELSGNDQQFVCVSTYENRFLFDQVPFPCDTRFSHTTFDRPTSTFKIDIGSTHGIVTGSQLSLHFHNQRHSKNPSFATAVVFDVHPTYSFARLKVPSTDIPTVCWSKVAHWHNHTPFRVRVKSTFFNFFQSWNFRRNVLTHPGQSLSEEGSDIMHVKDSRHADISLTIKSGDTVAIQHHTLPHSPAAVPAVVSLQDRTSSNDAARFNLHLLHGNSEQPLKGLVEADLRQLHPLRPLHQIC